MTKASSHTKDSNLRQKAYEVLEKMGSGQFDMQDYDLRKLIEELNVYHIELEIQNEELRGIRNRLESSQKYLGSLFTYAPSGYLVLTPEGFILDINRMALKYFGLDREFLKGRCLHTFVPQENFIVYNRCFRELMESGSPRSAEIRFRVKADHSFWARMGLFLLEDPGQNKSIILCALIDITEEKNAKAALQAQMIRIEAMVAKRTAELEKEVAERKKSEKKMRQYAERMKVIHKIEQAILGARGSDKISAQALTRLKCLVPFCKASVTVFDFEAGDALVLATEGGSTRNIPLRHFEKVIGQREIILIKDMSEVPDPDALHKNLMNKGVKSCVNIPLIFEGEIIGSLNLGAETKEAFSSESVEIVQEVANSLAIAIVQTRLHEQTRKDAETKTILLREINHRVKNNLSSIMGMLYAEKEHVKAEETQVFHSILNDLLVRVRGLSAVHDMLSDSEWKPLLMSELIEKIIYASLQSIPYNKHISVEVTCRSDIRTSPTHSHHLAMVINELATNTVKYALEDRDKVQITVRSETQDNRIKIVYQDNGPGYPDEVLKKGLQSGNVGFKLINGIVCRTLEGSLSLYNDRGAVTVIEFEGD